MVVSFKGWWHFSFVPLPLLYFSFTACLPAALVLIPGGMTWTVIPGCTRYFPDGRLLIILGCIQGIIKPRGVLASRGISFPSTTIAHKLLSFTVSFINLLSYPHPFSEASPCGTLGAWYLMSYLIHTLSLLSCEIVRCNNSAILGTSDL